jgi:hypothetical protein
MTTGLELVLDEFARKRLDGGQLFERHDGWSARLDLCPRNKAASASVRTETNDVMSYPDLQSSSGQHLRDCI